MIIVPHYYCRNCKKSYSGTRIEIPNTPLEKLVPAARYTLGSQDHIFRIAGKVIQMSDLHMCNDHEVGLANFTKLQIEGTEKKENNNLKK